MRKFCFIVCILSLFTSSALAQDENAAFYIYQNDGHFNGFFYDEVEKITYSRVDTAGIEWDDYVSQEIVTEDSTYRIMLSAIDSVGFVQPEVKMNPRVHEVNIEGNLVDFDMIYVEYQYWDTYQLIFHMPNIDVFPAVFREAFAEEVKKYIPQVGDIYACFGEYGWAQKVVSVEQEGEYLYKAKCEDIIDITDLFIRQVGIEEYGYNPEGKMISRRVAGRPDLTVGNPSKKKAKEGQWEGDLFNFSLGGHFTLYADDDLTITIDPSIEGKLNVKAEWNLSWFGDKYIGITSTLKFGVGAGFTVDGKIKDFFPGGVGGLLGGVPIPATCPIVYLDIAPDAFLRGEAHVKFSAASPKLQGAMWSKLEISNWVPSMAIGFGNADGKAEEFESIDTGSSGLSLELSGFVQGGMLFPMKFKSLPVLKKIFDTEIGGQWFVGPKLAGSIALDLTTAPWDDAATYNQLKNAKLSMHMVDADYEVKGTVKTAFSGKKEVTLADGSISLFPPFDAPLVPEFGKAHDYYEERWQGNEKMQCRIISFEPSGYVLKPVDIGVVADVLTEEGTYEGTCDKMYYHFAQLFGQPLDKSHWAEYVIPTPVDNRYPLESKRYKIRPAVKVGKILVADPVYEILHGVEATVSSDSLWLNHDLTDAVPIKVLGTVDVPNFGEDSALKATKINGGYEVGRGPHFLRGMNYSPCDTLEYYDTPAYFITGTMEGCKFYPLGLKDPRYVHIFTLPNTDNPIGVNFSLIETPYEVSSMIGARTIAFDDPDMTYNISRRSDNMGWDIVADWRKLDYTMHLSYTLVVTEKGRLRQDTERPQFAMKNVQMTYKRNFTENETYTIKVDIDNWDFSMDYIGGRVVNSVPATYIVKKPNGSTQKSTIQLTIGIDTIFN